MMKNFKYILAAAAIVVAGQACSNKDLSEAEHVIRISSGFAAGGGPSKALLESDDLLSIDTKVKVYALATDSESAAVDIQGYTKNGTQDIVGNTKLNDGQILGFYGAGTGTAGWQFDNGGEFYKWNNEHDYRFFGWLDTDGSSNLDPGTSSKLNATGFFGNGFSYSDGVLTVPAKTMGLVENNLDFAYSDVILRKRGNADYSDVTLPLHHIFASFSISARNYTKEPVYIEAVLIHGLRDGKSASIDFTGDNTAVTYSDGSVMAAINLVSSQIALTAAGDAGDSKKNIAFGASNTRKSFLVWPQTLAELTPAPYSGDWNPGENEPYIEVRYRQSSSTATPMTAKLPIPHDTDLTPEELNGWAGGTHRAMELSFSNKKVILNVYADDWNEDKPTISYDGAVMATRTLRIAKGYENNCVVAADSTTVYFKAGYPIVLEFTIDQPQNATWLVSKKGDFDVFEIDNFNSADATVGDGDDSAEGLIDGKPSRIAIIPRITELQKAEYSTELSFYVRLNSGEMINADANLFNKAGDTQDHNKPLSPIKFVLIKQ